METNRQGGKDWAWKGAPPWQPIFWTWEQYRRERLYFRPVHEWLVTGDQPRDWDGETTVGLWSWWGAFLEERTPVGLRGAQLWGVYIRGSGKLLGRGDAQGCWAQHSAQFQQPHIPGWPLSSLMVVALNSENKQGIQVSSWVGQNPFSVSWGHW